MLAKSLCFFAVLFLVGGIVYSHIIPLERGEEQRYNLKYIYRKKTKCGYDACPEVKKGVLNVHLVPHTHNDVGWLKTVDQYYFGSKSSIQKAGVQYILDSVVKELLHDPNKRFIYVETSFLWKWLKEQHDIVRHQVKNLVNNGQLEIIGGGWSMNDEAVTNYQSIIDQFTWGFRKLNDTFGECGRPHVGWQIDPFGHSREMASILSQMGYDGLFFSRLDYQDRHERLMSKTAELIWDASPNLGKAAQLFTSVLYNGYGPPPGFCFDILCDDEPIIDDKYSPDYNVDKKVSSFIRFAKEQARNYSSENIMMTMGGDFTYQNAHMWYKNLDRLISYVNDNASNVNVFYSTPSCYLKAVNNADLTWPTKQDDFFPYASDPHSYWTGYFTSRPTIKYFERQGNNFLQVCKQLYALADLGPEDWVYLNTMREAMGVMQHHDAITGTEKQKVADDYTHTLTQGFRECLNTAETALNQLMSHQETTEKTLNVSMDTCLKLNISQCEPSETFSKFVVTVYNPLSHPVSQYVRLPVTGKVYSVQNPTGTLQTVQVVPIPKAVLMIPGRISDAEKELVFQVQDLPPLGFRSYFVKQLDSSAQNRDDELVEELAYSPEKDDFYSDEKSELSIGNLNLGLVVDGITGITKKMYINGKTIPLEQNFYYYKGYIGNNEEFLNRSSGAYIFRPNGTEAILVSTNVSTHVYKGALVEEIHQTFSDWVSQVIRLYKDENHIEFEWLVGSIPINDNIGKEVISRFSTKLNTDGIFYTDSNGRELLQRKRNFRPTWKVKIVEKVAGNYYPVTSKILIRDNKLQEEVAVLTDRAQGGSSLHDGEMELMVHRRLLHDDAFGVNEALNETAFNHGLLARGRHFVIGGPISGGQGQSLAAQERKLAQQKLLNPWVFLTPAETTTFQEWASTHYMEFQGLTKALPPNVHILTLEPWKAHSFLLRLEHILEARDDPKLSKPVTVNLKNLFATFSIKSARETTLGGNQWLSETKRLKWKADSNEIDLDYRQPLQKHNFAEEILSITLNPMQIRTFIIEIKNKL